MARRYDHSREELLEMALGAAREIVAKEGFRSLTTRKLANEIGYSVGTIYNLFENLDDLAIQLNGVTLDELHEELSSVEASDKPEVALEALAAKYIRFTQENFNLWNCLFEHRLPQGEALPERYGSKVARLLGLIEDALLPLFNGRRTKSCQLAARVLWSSMHGICSLSNTEKLDVITEETAVQLSRSLITNYLAGLRAAKA